MPSGGVVLSLAAHRGGPAQNRLALSWGPPRGAWASLHPYFKTAVLVLETSYLFTPRKWNPHSLGRETAFSARLYGPES